MLSYHVRVHDIAAILSKRTPWSRRTIDRSMIVQRKTLIRSWPVRFSLGSSNNVSRRDVKTIDRLRSARYGVGAFYSSVLDVRGETETGKPANGEEFDLDKRCVSALDFWLTRHRSNLIRDKCETDTLLICYLFRNHSSTSPSLPSVPSRTPR